MVEQGLYTAKVGSSILSAPTITVQKMLSHFLGTYPPNRSAIGSPLKPSSPRFARLLYSASLWALASRLLGRRRLGSPGEGAAKALAQILNFHAGKLTSQEVRCAFAAVRLLFL